MVNGLPMNSFTNSNSVTAITASPPTAASGSNGGWLYNTTTGQIYVDYAQGLTW
jgi:general secretion pathway protein G